MNDVRPGKVTEPATPAGLLDRLDDFEKAWQNGTPPRIEDFWPPAPADPATARQLLVELVKTDLEYRWRRGAGVDTHHLPSSLLAPCPRLEDYVARYPELGPPDRLPVELIGEEYRVRHCWGDRPGVAEYVARFAEQAAPLTEVLRRIAAELAAEVSADDGPRTILDRTASAAPPRGPAALPVVPGFHMLEVLGQGGMGIVYKARQANLDRLVALKMISAGDAAQTRDLTRFRTEAEAVARLQHPNIVQIHAVGDYQGRPYFVLEYVAGGSLAQRLAGTPQPARPAAQLAETLARAMHFAHQRGIVHRDLKPANVLLQVDAEQPLGGTLESAIPKITDFGLAKRLDQEVGQTQSGAIMGTPSYIAPEQAAGQSRASGPAADVYALGAVLYEVLTGQPPFRGETVLDTLLLVRTQDPVPPTRLQPKVPRDLETICLKCLHKDAARRYASAAALADDLHRFLAGEPIRARRAGPWQRAVKWSRRRPAVVGLLAVLALTLTGGFLGMAVLWLRAEEARREAVQAKERADRSFRLALEAIGESSTGVARHPRLQQHELADLREHFLRNVDRYYQELRARPGAEEETVQLARGSALLKLGGELFQLGHYQQANDTLDKAHALFQRLAEAHPDAWDHQRNLAYSLFQIAGLHYNRSRFDLAEQLWQKALALGQRLLAAHPDDPEYLHMLAATRNNLGLLYLDQGRLAPAEEQLRQGLDLSRHLADALPTNGEEQKAQARAQLNLGRLYRDTGRTAQALPLLAAARAGLQRLADSRPGSPGPDADLNLALVNLGRLYHMTGQDRLAEQAYQQAVAVNQRLAAAYPEEPGYRGDLALSYMNLGDVYQSTGRTEQAERALTQALSLYEPLVARYPENADFTFQRGATYLNLGAVRDDLEEPQEALRWYDRAIHDLEATRQQNPQKADVVDGLVFAHGARAVALGKLGRHGESAAALRRASEMAKGQIGPELRICQALAWVYAGDHSRATATAKDLARQENLPAAFWYELGHVYAVAATALRRDVRLPAADRLRLAEAYAEQAVTLWRKARAGGYVLAPQALKRLLAQLDSVSPHGREAVRRLLEELEQEAKGKAR